MVHPQGAHLHVRITSQKCSVVRLPRILDPVRRAPVAVVCGLEPVQGESVNIFNAIQNIGRTTQRLKPRCGSLAAMPPPWCPTELLNAVVNACPLNQGILDQCI